MKARTGAVVTAFVALSSLSTGVARAQDACFKRLDTGTDLTGWRRSTTNHHGPGTGWTAENGALVGRQTAGAQGGILMTDAMYKDVEVVFEVKLDWGCDSGFFFRTTAGDRGYQELIDHLPNGAVGPFYGEGFATELYHRPYYLTNMGATAVKDPALTPIFDLATWPTLWKPTDFNEIRVRVEGNPPHMQAWISGVKVADYTDPMKRNEINETGPLAIQVHGGADRWKQPDGSVAFRNIRVKDLTMPCVVDAGAGDARDAASTTDAGAVGDASDAGGGAATGAAGAGGSGGGAGAGGGGGAGMGGGGAGAGGGTTGSAGMGGLGGGAGTTGGAGTAGGGAGTAGGGAGTAAAGNRDDCGCATADAPLSRDAAWFVLALALVAARRKDRGAG